MKRKIFLTFLFSWCCISFVLASGLFDKVTPLSDASVAGTSTHHSSGANENIQKLATAYTILLENYVDELDADKLYKAAMKGMFDSLKDQYSEYFEQDSQLGINLQDTTTGNFGGIGVTITKQPSSTEEKPAYVEVMSAMPGTPGAKAGILSGDYIIEINGTKTDEITMNDVLSILRGKPGTEVTIKILRGKNLVFDLKVIRAKIEVPTVKYQMLNNGIGYIQLIEFNPNSAPKILEAYDELVKKGCTKLILDLRDNPGGLLSAAIQVTSLFFESGVVTSTDGRMKNSKVTYSVDRMSRHIPTSVPVVTLINGGTASSSEILAGALKDYKRTVLVGEKTYGKGVVQMIYDLSATEAFKFTSARYYSPTGANINGKGIPADYEVSQPTVLDSEADEFARLYAEGRLDTFAKSKPNITNNEIRAFAKQLQSSYNIRLEILEVAVKSRVNSYSDSINVDIEFDPQLKEAVRLLTTQDVHSLAKNTKTLLELHGVTTEK